MTCLHRRILSNGSHFITIPTNLVSLCKAGSEKGQKVWTEPQYLLQQNMGTVKNGRTQEPTGQDRAAMHQWDQGLGHDILKGIFYSIHTYMSSQRHTQNDTHLHTHWQREVQTHVHTHPSIYMDTFTYTLYTYIQIHMYKHNPIHIYTEHITLDIHAYTYTNKYDMGTSIHTLNKYTYAQIFMYTMIHINTNTDNVDIQILNTYTQYTCTYTQCGHIHTHTEHTCFHIH